MVESNETESRARTLRQDIVEILRERALSVREISKILSISEREVLSHLEHIRRSLNRSGHFLVVNPAVCKKCGFSFRKREKFGKPGKCPICKNTNILPQTFSLKER